MSNDRSKLKILIVDDDPLILNILELTLKSLGCSDIVKARGGVSCLRTYNSSFDLIFLDINMPDMNGIETLKELMEINYLAYVVMVSSDTSFERYDKTYKLGASGFVTKPINPNKIATELCKYESLKKLSESSNKYI